MWGDQIFELTDTVRSSIPIWMAVLLPLLILLSPADAAVEFPAYRLQQFDLQGVKYGSRISSFNFEARTMDTATPNRKCVLLSINEFSPSRFQELVNAGIGSLLIIIPEDLQNVDQDVRENLLSIEKYLLSRDVDIPVYFLPNSTEIQSIYQSIIDSTQKESSGSAFEAIMNSVSSSGFQVAVYGSTPKLLQNLKIANIQGKLQTNGLDGQLPTIVVVAYYDSFGASSDLSFGADSNGSGVAALIELARLFSLLTAQASQNSLPHFNLVFLLSGGGKINYLGSKKFLDDHLDGLDSSLLQDTHFVLCLDSIGSDGELNIHVSKQPKEGSSIAQFVESLEKIASSSNENVTINLVHKKINLAEDFLAWEHERYSIRRLTAMTASHFKTPKADTLRGSILDTRSTVDLSVLSRNVRLLAEALATQLYKSQGPFFVDNLTPSKEVLSLWMDLLTNQSRSHPAMADGSATIVSMLNQVFQSYLGDVRMTHLVADKRDPEFGFYDQTLATVTVYSVKPAIFDLVLTFTIAIYLSAVYFGVQGYNFLYAALLGCYQHVRPKMS